MIFFVRLFILAMLLLTLFSCHNDSTENNDPVNTAPQAPTL